MFGKRQNPQQTQQSTAQHPVLSYLPEGWEFAIITIKPPKGCNNTENKAVRRGSVQPECPGQRPGAGSQGAGGFVRRRAALVAPTAKPYPLTLHLPGLTWVVKQA